MSELEKLINKATDPTLTSDNWQYILDVCDNISTNPEEQTKQAIRIITLRLNTKDANVMLRTLALITAVAENCGSRMKQEIATKSFLYDCLIKKLSDRKIHKTIKISVAQVIGQLHESFKSDPSLKPMTDAYNTVASDYKQFLSQKPDTFGPSKPAKQEMSQSDKVKEDEDLQRVLKLSLQEYEREKAVRKAYLNDKPLPVTRTEAAPQQLQPQNSAEQTIATVSKVRALYDLISYEPDELSFRKGDIISVIESVYRDWWRGSLPNGKVGIFPLNYVTPIVSKSAQELESESAWEDNILSNESRKIDRLLGLLSTNSPDLNEDEITDLYNQILPLRPALANSIEKYSSRKEELTSLNGQLNVQIKFFNELVDNSINQRINHQYSGAPATSMPYPSFPQFLPQNPSSDQGYIAQQPTSSGFGNAPRPAQATGSVPQTYPSYPQYGAAPEAINVQPNTHQGSNPFQTTGSAQQYSNINSFPSVNQL
ncbi:ESCRT-0 subunit protein hse1 [Yamadazyma tenuis]|uniref:Class E vacuolar protein-sorting machinery protein HSE1 n=1 Tax=Candida tenuis (strain ATCC 10573 / BCRC 21748 / CBS 615 / JCM 9827 / NBRC 10315 / NRRL Y-1498 / VKM Y-70) TaxID=590646 RepID=G3B079_CANTC|nr:uncharacterized protein CANTEDRAFT_113056 [Yamadazyma tenuis ATCC 10573]EGV65341.1 hypothetical protein CANTEDRAFT_113056 [Yamadazyma tenuis ATCC 10573]WEJ95004.1 ESCRT-0 subunit protein hse1 [Yamadazyma tenuis]